LRRKLSLLGGTTTRRDVAIALRHLPGRELIDGPALAQYEQAFARTVGVAHARAFATGRVGLFGILTGLGVGAGDEVLLQAPTHIVVPNAIRAAGARPVYADCVPANWNIDLDDAARKITRRTRVLLVQQTFGIPADMDRVGEFCDAHGLVLVEDCVHALGATWGGRPAGSFGRAAFFSTEETKVISTTMGGMVVTDDEVLDAAIARFQTRCAPPPASRAREYLMKLLVYHALTQPELHRFLRTAYEATGRRQPLPVPTHPAELAGGVRPGYEERLSNGQAAVGLSQLAQLADNLVHRRAVAARYGRLLDPARCTPADVPEAAEPSWVRYPVYVADRPAAVRALAAYTVPGTWFSSVLEEADSLRSGAYEAGSCPVAEDASRHLVNLPTHPRVRPEDAERIAAALTC
jgi:dTDP-4-amino-4,6-dideoxygalactose transaminase